MKSCYHILLLIFFLLIQALAFGQQTQNYKINLDWNLSIEDINSKKSTVELPTFRNAKIEDRGYPYSKFSKLFKIQGPGIPKVTITNPVYQEFNLQQRSIINTITDHNIYAHIIQERGEYFLGINLDPLISKDGKTIGLKSFELDISILPSEKTHLKSGPEFKSNSELANGDIYKIKIPKRGIYKIDFSFIQDSLALDPASIDIRRMRVLGNNGGKVPEALEENRIDDLVSLGYYENGLSDGNFGEGDFILFYSEGPNKIRINSNESESFSFHSNVYNDYNYVFLSIGGDQNQVIPTRNNLPNGSSTLTEYDDFQVHAIDDNNLLGNFASTQGSGQDWYGEYFNNRRLIEFQDQFDFTNLVRSAPAKVKMSFAGRSNENSLVKLKVEDLELESQISKVRTGNVESTYAQEVVLQGESNIRTSNPIVQVRYDNSAVGNEGWLNELSIQMKKELNFSDGFLIFQNLESADFVDAGFSINNFSNGLIWDITNPTSIVNQAFSSQGSISTFGYMSENETKSFIAFDPSANFPNPLADSKIENQNLHSITDADLIIIYKNDFNDAAQRLAEHRERQDGFTVEIVDIDQLFNEFSCGRKDPSAIRDFAKMIYDRSDRFKYLLLLGDGSYDYRNVTEGIEDQNFIPVYETISSLNPLSAFPTDDYFALLSDTEGDNLRGALDIAVGRIPCKTASEANTVIDKIIRYESDPKSFGDWRTRLLFSADDEDSGIHLRDEERIAVSTASKHAEFNQEKVYFDAFRQESTPGGARYPQANAKINETIFKGTLIYNYLGHGGPKGLSQERVLKVDDINSWVNYDKLPIMITATCSFTGFDDPNLLTAGEEAILSPNGGAVALLSTVRSVYASQNFRLTQSVFDTIFTKSEGEYLRLGEVLRRAKNSNSSDTISINARKFLVIGDPSLKIGIPNFDISTDLINGQSTSTSMDTVGALSKIEIEGSIRDINGNIIDDFNGTVFPTVYDKTSNEKTLKNDQESPIIEFEVRRNILFKGSATVTNGKFKFSFVVPVDINYDYGQGRISYYAYNGEQGDAFGYTEDIMVGGSSQNSISDNTPPQVDVFMNEDNFAFGGITDDSPILLVKLSDDIGINISSSSIGHSITGVLDNNTQESLDLNEFFVGAVDDFTSGEIRFPLQDLETGRHTISIKAFDVANNSGEGYTEFIVLNGDKTSISQLLNYPNPFTTSTEFSFEHELNGTNLDVQLDIYTLSGKLVKTITESKFTQGNRISGLKWDGFDDLGQSLGRGIYLYKVKINAPELNISSESTFEKLVILK